MKIKEIAENPLKSRRVKILVIMKFFKNIFSKKQVNAVNNENSIELDKIKVSGNINTGTTSSSGEERITPLHSLCQIGNMLLISSLIKQGANVNATTSFGVTPLMIACQEGHLEVAKLLISNGAEINIQNKDGFTPLHVAAGWGNNPELVLLLIQNGGDIHKLTNNGRSIYYYALTSRNAQIISNIEKHGGNSFPENGYDPVIIAMGLCQSLPNLNLYINKVFYSPDSKLSSSIDSIKNILLAPLRNEIDSIFLESIDELKKIENIKDLKFLFQRLGLLMNENVLNTMKIEL